ncbi:PAS domain S-box-containing protein/diguanylate cyclase (GGDEF) domain-containing protein [Rhodoferax sp. OV413]|uniref:sensor domain-containing diguanylate cyclase n=1 Tax=Rhodoferax sp. OV413 TaxID=1855285 RepID=UPI0008825982|nr:diguanylate cyclase [Rhodoferax sp. OV413]SDP73558.1 PAS domain S-box-containing protein/diguanylate cyclase (GGDEF) domain-containing protein [Rhodoferax sp. OV413]
METVSHVFARFGWVRTLKFKIVAMAVVTGVLSALVTTQLVLFTTQANIQQMLMQGESDDVERTAALLGTKIDMLRDALKAVARQAPAPLWDDPAAMQGYLASNQGLNALFESVLAARSDGAMLARMAKDQISTDLPNIGDRAYFQQALRTDQPVLSDPLVARVAKTPVVIIAISSQAPDSQVVGVIAGVLRLQSNNLFSEVTRTVHSKGARVLIMDRAGVLLAHTNPAQLLGPAAEEPGLMDVFSRWHAVGSPIDTTGAATLSQGHLVAMAGIPDSDWTLVRLTPLAAALQPVDAAQATAWKAAGGVGLLAALLAGAVAWRLTRPISTLRARAKKMLLEEDSSTEGWPQDGGEIGQLALAFQQVVEQRQQKQGETQALLVQLEAVLDHAEVGITFTRNGHFELVSRQFCQIFQFDKQRVIGKPTRLMHPSAEAYQALSERAYPAFMQHGAFDGEVQLARVTGELFWAHMRGRAVMPGDQSKGTIWTVEDITASREHRERLAWTSSHDSLTGLVNRPAFEEQLTRSTERAGTEPFCAMFIDLDHFKQVNDTGGHAAGDALLRDVAHILAAQVRQADTVARLGGDEFAILLRGCPLPQALEVGEKLRSAVAAYRLPWEGQSFGVSTSIGLVAVDAGYPSAAEVMRAADAACYAAKEQGRNAVAVFDPQAPA